MWKQEITPPVHRRLGPWTAGSIARRQYQSPPAGPACQYAGLIGRASGTTIDLVHTVLLDVDGTLLDTEEFIFRAFEHTARVHGLSLPDRAVLRALIGEELGSIYTRFAREPAGVLMATHRAFQQENLDLVRPFPGASDALEELSQMGLALAAITTRSRITARASLDRAGLADYLGAVVAAEDAEALKPDPAPLKAGLRLLGREASGAVMVGDTPADIGAARALGIPAIAATYGFHGAAVLESGPDLAIAVISELPAAIRQLSA